MNRVCRIVTFLRMPMRKPSLHQHIKPNDFQVKGVSYRSEFWRPSCHSPSSSWQLLVWWSSPSIPFAVMSSRSPSCSGMVNGLQPLSFPTIGRSLLEKWATDSWQRSGDLVKWSKLHQFYNILSAIIGGKSSTLGLGRDDASPLLAPFPGRRAFPLE